MQQRALVVLVSICLIAGSAFAGGEVFDFSDEVKQGYDRPAFRAKEILKTPEYTVSALAVKEELKTHRHSDANHVLYVVSGQGTITLDEQTITLKPGMIVHIPRGVTHHIKAAGGEVTLLDFSSYTAAK